MSPVTIRHGSATDVGLVRQVNEDTMLTAPPVYAVADGMGGHSGGDVASGIVVEELAGLADGAFDSREGADAVLAGLARAQSRILEYGEAQRGTRPRWYAGTTVVVALLVTHEEEQHWLVTNLGDSRAYRFCGERLSRVSVDHSVVQELVDAGRITVDQAAVHPERHVITRALGSPAGAEPDLFRVPVASAPRLLLCTDGVNGMIDDPAVAEVLAGVADPQEAAERLVATALEAGGHDNATAVVLDADVA